MDVLTLPSNVHEVRFGGATAWVVPAVQGWATAVLAEGRTLYEDASAQDDVVELRGRGPVYAIAAPVGRWVVRRCRRGGALAPLLGQRFLRGGTPRPFREMVVGAEARKRGIPTPRVLAAAVYRAGPFYRADLVSEYVPDTRDLAAYLFGATAPREGATAPEPASEDAGAREEALRDAAYLVARMARAGVEHPDLNAKNVLVEWRDSRPSTLLVDLDRARVHAPGAARGALAMRARLERSLRKFEDATGRPLSAAEWTALRAPVSNGEGSG